MAEQSERFKIEYDLRPAYYDEFQCLAGNCRFTCCHGWRVTFDKKDYLSLKHQSGSPEFNERMSHCLRRIKKGPFFEKYYGEFNLPGGKCLLHREDGLCILQLEKGPQALPHVCRTYPRSEVYLPSGYCERSLSPSCEGVLELLWNLPDGVDFVSDPLPRTAVKSMVFRNPDSLSRNFQEIRSQCIDLLQNRRFPLPERILLMGLVLKELADGEQDIPRWLARTQTLSNQPDGGPWMEQLHSPGILSRYLTNCFHMLLLIKNSNPSFATVGAELAAGMGVQIHEGKTQATIPTAPYLAARERFEENFKGRDYFMENLMVSLFFYLQLPDLSNSGNLWKSYVNFCNLYSIYRFASVMSCREYASGDKDELFRLLVFISRCLIHNGASQSQLRDEFFQNDSATLAHMSVLLSG